MDTRREFIKKSMLLSGAAGLSGLLPPSIQRALAIDPTPGSTYMDAEHIVMLMQENRSFDHCFGSLRGVRGFNDPRAFKLANGKPVWCQTDIKGKTYAPFRLNLYDTKATWMGSLPHSRTDQVDAFNHGQFDQWLKTKYSHNEKYAEMPLTLGYYNRQDLPFNYAMADAFTICDQNFCSAMTSTWPNRIYFWTGNVRDPKTGFATIRNDLKPGEALYKTFPERLQENNIPWRVYQNDVTTGGGFVGEERAWLSNFGCNPLEWFSQYNVKFSSRYVDSLKKQTEVLTAQVNEIKIKMASLSPSGKDFSKLKKDLSWKQKVQEEAQADLKLLTQENFNKLTKDERALHEKAFSKNDGDPDYHKIEHIKYKDGTKERQVTVPGGDVFHQFREDVNQDKLPAVSWLVPPQNFSDHPSAPWYGSWYVSEVLDILTKNPEVWKKTIFILTYDENDGYFDHIPPFLPPDPKIENSGACSEGIETEGEFIRMDHELKKGISKSKAREAAIGMGYRVPMIVASPWSRGGQVCSQIFDHTSTLQFLEGFLNKKFNTNIKETNISNWRRTVCGDLTSVFKPYDSKKAENMPFLNRDHYIEKIYNAQFKQEPSGFKEMNAEGFALPQQEEGVRASCALPYELYVDGNLTADKKGVEIEMTSGNSFFGKRAAGSPFTVHAPNILKNWQYAVKAGDSLKGSWLLSSFKKDGYFLKVHGPNGFYREFAGDNKDPEILVKCKYEEQHGKPTGNIALYIKNLNDSNDYQLSVIDHAYHKKTIEKTIKKAGYSSAGIEEIVILSLNDSFGWYDFSIKLLGNEQFEKRYSGHVETGKESISDPYMGKMKM